VKFERKRTGLMKQQAVSWSLIGLAAGGLAFSAQPAALAAIDSAATQPKADYIRPHTACPTQVEDLTARLLRDLPSYANRVTQRSFRAALGVTLNQSQTDDGLRLPAERPGYVVLAGEPEFAPLTLGPGVYAPTELNDDDPRQVFFTLLERQYIDDRPINLQHYYWLFLAQSESGWWFVSLISRIGDLPADEPPTPPQNASQGVVAQAIRIWLRDCRSGDIAP